jgi:hypothetical protein
MRQNRDSAGQSDFSLSKLMIELGTGRECHAPAKGSAARSEKGLGWKG